MMGKETQVAIQQARLMQALLEAARAKADEQELKDVRGSLLVPVDLEGATSTLVRLDSPESKSGRVIPLQDEFAFHLMLATRVYSKIATDLKLSNKSEEELHKQIEIARQSAMNRVNHYIEHAYRDAYKVAAKKDGDIDLAKFNAALDKARKKLAPMAHTVLMEKIIEKTGIIFTEKDLKKAKDLAEKTPATDDDILYVNQTEGLATLIKGSKHTAHHRVAGKDQFAHRQMITCRMDEDGNITPGLHPRIQIRTPSPVVKKKSENFGEAEIISDVSKKLSEITERYGLEQAFVYNRYTAINDTLDELRGVNLQTQSARHILLGAHEYNAHHIDDGVFCFVQNISVNGFGDTLGYESSDPLVQESTLMAEMALMHTLLDEGTFDILIKNYKNYLKTSPRAPYFSDTKPDSPGNNARVHMGVLKNMWKSDTNTAQDPVSLAKMSLKKLVAHDLHFTHEYAKLVQTLSVFAEKASIGGCKSGNERAQAINGRVLMLDAMKKPDDKIAKALAALANAPEDGDATIAAAKALNTCINQEYNARGLYAAASVISLVDQGAAAKVEPKPKPNPKDWNILPISRNFAEESAEVMTNLKQSKAGKLQAHKGLTKYMRGAWSEHTLSDWAYLNSSALGVFGAVAAIVTVVPAIIAVLNHRIKKQHKIEARQRQNERIKAIEKASQDKKEKIKGWIKQIGRYDVEKDPKAPELHLTTEEKKALYRATHQGKTPKGAREDFIRFLGLKFIGDGTLDVTIANSGKTVTLKKLLGDEGFNLYTRAIKEEGKSKSFRRAVFEASLKHVEGSPWASRLILWIGGPSSSGKTFSANHVLKKLSNEHSELLGVKPGGSKQGNDVVFADGSFEREVSQMRQMVLQYALAKGYAGIEDLHKHSSELSVKKYLKATVLASDRFSMVIPDTFVREGALDEAKHYEELTKQGKFKQIFSEVKGEKSKIQDEEERKKINAQYLNRFKTAVKHMGELRAWRTDTKPFDVKNIAMNNRDIGCESKVYQPQHFWKGRWSSKSYKWLYKQGSQMKVTLKITNDLISLTKEPSGKWRECGLEEDITEKEKGKDFLIIPARDYHAWMSSKKENPDLEDLADWYEDKKRKNELQNPLIDFKKNDNSRSSSLRSINSGSSKSLGSSSFSMFYSKHSEETLEEKRQPKPGFNPGHDDSG
ncbi:MAG: hypothetical protein P1U39_05680 [Legionellaceae bacterium]|nr:hypothetical protein [Legionellaceae bacterium]